jgi:hypothetical protein
MSDVQSLPQTANANATPPNVNDGPSSGNPTTPAMSRGQIANTSISVSNSNVSHVCDIAGPLVYGIAWASYQIGQAIQAIREALQALWAAASDSPFGDAVRAVINTIKAALDITKKIIAKAAEVAAIVGKFISDMQQLLVTIATLPARIASILAQCVKESIAQIKLAEAAKETLSTDQAKSTVGTQITNIQSTLSENESIVNPSLSLPTYQKP